jgi:hypothetical protein
MSLYNGSASNGYYSYTTTLTATSHTYYFQFTSGSGTVQFDWPGVSGPTVTPAPTPTPVPTPVPTPAPAALSGGFVNTNSGYTYTTFVYFVHYYDPRGVNATSPFVYIDTTQYLMTVYSGNGSDGLYSYATNNLTAGSYTFYFTFTSGSTGQKVSLGSSASPFSGPTVIAPPTPTPTAEPEATTATAPSTQPENTAPPPKTATKSTPSPIPTPQPMPRETIQTIPTSVASTIPAAQVFKTNIFSLGALAATAIVGVTLLVTFQIKKKQQTLEPTDEQD